MSDELETAKQIISHPATSGTGIVALLGWLTNKVYRGIVHRIGNLEVAQQLANEATWKEFDRRTAANEKLFDMLREHEKSDVERFDAINNANRDRHDELVLMIGDLRTDIAALKSGG